MTIIDIRSISRSDVIECDICIVGSGPAGISLAREFAGRRGSIVVLESGGLEWQSDVQALADGTSVGVPYPPLAATRLRYLGGTSNHWGGNVRPLDAIDFDSREWIPNSGWPIDSNSISEFYRRAQEFFHLPDSSFDVETLSELSGSNPWRLTTDSVESRVFHTVGSPYLRVGQYYREFLQNAGNITVYLYATVTEIETAPSGRSVIGLRARSLAGQSWRITARAYVLATGGIENARLLLLSKNPNTGEPGNEHDAVGRYFMEHITVPSFCRLFPSSESLPVQFYRSVQQSWGESWGILALSASAQKHNKVGNFRFQITNIINEFKQTLDEDALRSLRDLAHWNREMSPEAFGKHVANIIAGIDDIASAGYQYLVKRPDYPLKHMDIVAIGEQVPNPDSRVYLGDSTDAFGLPTVELDWRITDLDSENIRRCADILARAFGESGIGRLLELFPDGVFGQVAPRPHIHHMGTTRMSSSAQFGVVDQNCKVHHTDNLFIAGSSVFPTVGNVNPTLTIVALAIRLADHLKQTVNFG